MRISELHLKAFGPFTELAFDFSGHAFQLIYGPNEGGKTSALRAIEAMLFGIPVHTRDSFIHPNSELRVGATLTDCEGREVSFVRRKGRKRIFLARDGSGEALPDNLLDGFLKGLELQRFRDIYCVDHEKLREGGELMVALKGLADDSLLAASDSANFPRLQTSLNAEIDDLFAAKRRTSEIKAAIADYQAAKRRRAEAEVSIKKWQTLQTQLEEQQRRKDQVVAQRLQIDTQKRRLERLRNALPKVAEWKQWNEKLAGKDAAILPGHYSIEDRQACESELHFVKARAREFSEELARMEAELRDLEELPDAIAHSVKIDGLVERLGTHLRDSEDRVQYEQDCHTASHAMHRLLAEIGAQTPVHEVETLRLRREYRATIRSLAMREERLRQRQGELAQKASETRGALHNVCDQIAAIGPCADDQSVVAELRLAQQNASVEEELESANRAHELLLEETRMLLARLPLWDGTLDELCAAKLPLRATVDEFSRQFVRWTEQLKSTESELADRQEELAQVRQDINAAKRTTAVVTEEDLTQSRAKRNRSWKEIKDWRHAQERVSNRDPTAMFSAFEQQLEETDDIADRLRREADRVAELAQREEYELSLTASVRKLTGARDASRTELDRARAAWLEQWQASGVATARSPREMAAWLDEVGGLLQQAQELKAREGEVQRLHSLRVQVRESLSREVGQFGVSADEAETLSVKALIDRVSAELEEHRDTQARNQRLQHDKQRLTSELTALTAAAERANAELVDWQRSWANAMQWIDCPDGTSATQATERVECIVDLLDRYDQWRHCVQQIERIDTEAQQFHADVRAVSEQLDPGLVALPVREAVQGLKTQLDEANKRAELAKAKQQQCRELTGKLQNANKAAKELDNRLAAFRQAAGVDSSELLAEIEDMSVAAARRKALEKEIDQISGGADRADFIKLATETDGDQLEAQIAELELDLREQDENRDRVVMRISEIASLMEEIDGNDSAAVADQEAVSCLSGIHEAAQRYVRLKIAANILQQQVERYRERNKDPLLSKASQYFAAITCEEFSGLRVDYDDNGNAVIVGVRRSRKEVHVDAMSSGTCDAMFLSLRLAYLQRRLSQHEPFPFIVDDILIHLDDERALATLHVLAELSKETQVLFFTHHDRLRQLAEINLPPDALNVHELERRSSEITSSPRIPK